MNESKVKSAQVDGTDAVPAHPLERPDGDSGLAKSERKKKKGGNGEVPLGKATSLSSNPPIVWKNLGILWIKGRMRSFWLPFIACGHVMASAWLHENCKKMQMEQVAGIRAFTSTSQASVHEFPSF